jgi:hypothetical protein
LDNRWEIQSRIENTVRYIQKLPHSPNETDVDRAQRIKVLHEKVEILRQCLAKKDREEAAKRQEAQTTEAEATALKELQNVRYSADPLIRTMRLQGVGAIPLNSVAWQRTESPIIEIKCASGEVRKLDLRKIATQHWKLLTESRFTPLFIGVEAAGKIVDGKRTGLLQDGKFHGNTRIVALPTYLALMLV